MIATLTFSLICCAFFLSRKSNSGIFKISKLYFWLLSSGLVYLADWLYLFSFYAIYESYGFKTKDQARLFGVWFLAASATAPIVGKLSQVGALSLLPNFIGKNILLLRY
jgi:hypothetical protein